MDDVTLTEIITKGSDSADSSIAHYINHLELWSTNNRMKMNSTQLNSTEVQEDETNHSCQHSEQVLAQQSLKYLFQVV